MFKKTLGRPVVYVYILEKVLKFVFDDGLNFWYR